MEESTLHEDMQSAQSLIQSFKVFHFWQFLVLPVALYQHSMLAWGFDFLLSGKGEENS